MKRIALAALAAALAAAAPAYAFDGWHQVGAVAVPSGTSAWDYVSYEAARQRLFIGHRKEGLQVFDVAAGKLVATIAGTPAASSNGALLIPDFDLGISSNEDGSLTPFSLSTLADRPAIKLGEELDNSHYDAATKRIVVNMAASKGVTEAVVLQAPGLERVGSITLPTGKLEAGDGDGKGTFFLAARDVNKVFRVDMNTLKVTAEWPTPGCAQTNSLVMDAANNRILLGCRGSDTVKPSFVVMNAATGAIVYAGEIGGGNDSIVYDADLKRIFLANGVGAVINVFEQLDADTYKPVEALGVRSGVRALAIDPKTKLLYSVMAEGSADMSKKIITTVGPFYANTFRPNTFTVLTFGK